MSKPKPTPVPADPYKQAEMIRQQLNREREAKKK
jgi:hypothetical protein